MGGDEISQVCQMEIQGIQFAIKGSLEVAKYFFKAIQALLRWAGPKIEEGIETQKEKKLEKVGGKIVGRLKETGNKTMAEIMKLSKDGLPQMLYIPQEQAQEIYEALQKSGVRFFIPPDLDPSDGKVPIMLPPQDMSIASAVVKPFMEEKLSDAQRALKEYNEQIAELKERIVTASSEERAQLLLDLDHLTQGREEMENVLEGIKSDIASECKGSFMDYLKMGKDTDFEKDPDKAITELEQGVEIGKKFPIDECLQPVRDRVMMPETKLSFYVPDSGVTIEREFIRNEGDKTVCSEYTFRTETGEIYRFSDAGYTKDEWNEKIVPEMLDKAGLLEKSECRVFKTQERMKAYVEYYGKITPKSEEEIKSKQKEHGEHKGFSNADILKEAKTTNAESRKGEVSAKSDNSYITVTIPKNTATQKDGKIIVDLGDGISCSFPEAHDPKMKDGTSLVFSVKKTDVVLISGKNLQYSYSAKEIAGNFLDMKEKALSIIGSNREQQGTNLGKNVTEMIGKSRKK